MVAGNAGNRLRFKGHLDPTYKQFYLYIKILDREFLNSLTINRRKGMVRNKEPDAKQPRHQGHDMAKTPLDGPKDADPLFGDPAELARDRAERAVHQWEVEMPELGGQLTAMLVLGRLAETTQAVSRDILAPAFDAMGLKPGEFDVLATLVRSGPPYTLTPTELYRSTMTSSGGMTARLDKLEKNRLIERQPHPEDRRALSVKLTDKGLRLIKTALPGYVAIQEKAVSGLSAAEQTQLAELLKKLLQSLDQD